MRKVLTCAVVASAAFAAMNSSAMAQPSRDFVWTGSQAIPDNTTAGGPGITSVTQVVPADPLGLNTIADVDVDIIINHSWQGDLIIELELVGGPRVPLIHRAGDSNGSGNGFSANNFGNPATGTPFLFDDEADDFYDSSVGWGTIADPGIANVTGSWRPYGIFNTGGTDTLSAFDGLSKEGIWILHVSDNAGGDTGTIEQFSLHFTNVPDPATLTLLGIGSLAMIRRRRNA